jgi:hypothetical protein
MKYVNAFTPEFLKARSTSELVGLLTELIDSQEDNEFMKAVVNELKTRKQ